MEQKVDPDYLWKLYQEIIAFKKMDKTRSSNRASRKDQDQTIPDPKVQSQFREITDRANQETEDNQQRIASAKDKAQLSTTGSLSLTLIIVLKHLLEDITSGHGNTMLYISLGLVIVCLAFQTAIAFLTIYIYSKKKTAPVPRHESPLSLKTKKSTLFSKHLFQTDFMKQQDRRESLHEKTPDENEQNPYFQKEVSPVTAHIFQLFQDLDSSDSKKPWYFMFFPHMWFSAHDKEEKYNVYEATRKLHDILAMEKLKATFEFTEAQVNASSSSDEEGSSNEEEQKAHREQTKANKEVLKSKRKKLKALTTQHKLLDLHLDLQWRRKAFAKLFRLQQYLTYLTYIVFVLNSFITGFGLTK